MLLKVIFNLSIFVCMAKTSPSTFDFVSVRKQAEQMMSQQKRKKALEILSHAYFLPGAKSDERNSMVNLLQEFSEIFLTEKGKNILSGASLSCPRTKARQSPTIKSV